MHKRRRAVVHKTTTLSIELDQTTCGYISTLIRHFRALATHSVMLLASFPGLETTCVLVLLSLPIRKCHCACVGHSDWDEATECVVRVCELCCAYILG